MAGILTKEQLKATREAGAAWCSEELFERIFVIIDDRDKALREIRKACAARTGAGNHRLLVTIDHIAREELTE